MRNLANMVIITVLGTGMLSCCSGEYGYSGGEADAIHEPAGEQVTEPSIEGSPDVVRDPDAPDAAEKVQEIAEAPGGEEIVDVNQEEEEPVRTARWICSTADNPDRIGGCRNGSEVCDDDAFTVTGDLFGPLILACYADDPSLGHGIAFVSTNTGPQCSELPTCSGLVNDRPRCQGWEKCECENAWDPGNTQYASDGQGVIKILDCPPEGATRDVDLSAYAGQNMWVGSHTQPDGTGRMTESCLSKKTW